MEVLRIKGGHRFRLRHGPSEDVETLNSCEFVAFCPRGFTNLKTKVLVKEGDKVELGQIIVEHKRNAAIKFASPAAGHVHEVRYGPRRVLEAVVIAIDHVAEKNQTPKNKISENDCKKLSKSDAEKFLVENGFWPYLECFPGWGFAPLSSDEVLEGDVKKTVEAVHISLVNTEDYWPKNKFLVEKNLDELRAGIALVSRLSEQTRIYLEKNSSFKDKVADLGQVFEAEQKYPAENIGVQAWYKKPLKKNELVIGAQIENLIDVGHMALHGKKRVERLYSVSGNASKNSKHFFGRLGVALGNLVQNPTHGVDEVRFIAGGLFRGEKIRFQDFLSPNDVSVQALVEDKKRIPFVFFRLGADRLTLSKTWAAGFSTDKIREATTSNNGEERACIQCGYCIDICPVGLLPNLIMKAAVTKDIEKMEWLSIHDCVDCGLCTFVCPSKIELGQNIEAGKQLIEKEG